MTGVEFCADVTINEGRGYETNLYLNTIKYFTRDNVGVGDMGGG